MFNFALNVDRFALLLDVCSAKERAVNRLIGCLIGGAVHQPFEGNATTAQPEAETDGGDDGKFHRACPRGGNIDLRQVCRDDFGSASSPSASDLLAADQDF